MIQLISNLKEISVLVIIIIYIIQYVIACYILQ